MTSETLLPVIVEVPTTGQQLYVRIFTGVMTDLVVLNLFVEYSGKVRVDTFTTSLLAAIVLQLLLKATIAVEHRVGAYFKAKPPSGWMTFLRFFCAWLVLFGSKFVILEAIALAFGHNVHFDGLYHGIITLVVVVVVMLLAEEAIARVYRALGSKTAG